MLRCSRRLFLPNSTLDTDAEAQIGVATPVEKTWAVGTLTYDRRAIARLFTWLLAGDFAWNMKERAINPIAQIMLRRAGAADWIVGLLVGSIPSAIGLVLSPVASVKSDRCRSRLGRR